MTFSAILFDCDGVLVDSEPISLKIMHTMLVELGWQITEAECKKWFVGQSTKDDIKHIEKQMGKKLDPDWIQTFLWYRNQALRLQVVAVAGIYSCLKKIRKIWPAQIACVSAAEKSKVLLQLDKLGLTDFFNGYIFSGVDTPYNKPYPDPYLAAASALGVSAEHCAIIEDSVIGISAGVAAGATVFAYCPADEDPTPLLQAGAHATFQHMQHLPDLLQGCAG